MKIPKIEVVTGEFGRSKVRAPRRVKRFVAWCQQHDAKFAFFAFFTFPFFLSVCLTGFALFVLPHIGDTIVRILAFLVSVSALIVRVGEVTERFDRIFGRC